MKTIAIIAELNPAHNGHAWLFENARRLSGADQLIVLLSGNFVQRGEPSIFDKYLRTEMALLMGADLVLELPVAAATGSARRFAEGACSILDKLGCVDELWFGSESGNMESFFRLSAILSEEPDDFRALLQKGLSNGLPFAAARETALRAYLQDDADSILSVLRTSNNILGLEYCLALKRLGSSIRPQTLLRQGSSHTDTDLSADGFSSASSIRKQILAQNLSMTENAPGLSENHPFFVSLKNHVPPTLYPLYNQILNREPAISANCFSDMLRYVLWHTEAGSFSQYMDVSEDLGNRIEELRPHYTDIDSFALLLKTKDRSLTHIRRALLHILLDISKDQALPLSGPDSVRILGRSSNAAPLFSACKKRGRLTLFSGGAALNDPQYAADLFSSHLYESVRSKMSGTIFRSEFSRTVLMPKQP